MKLAKRLCLISAIGLSAGCNLYLTDAPQEDSLQPGESAPGDPPRQIVADVLRSPVRNIDLLFVIDNSGSMRDEQESLATWSQDSLFGVLKTQSLEDFDLHVAVVSTDVGTGPGSAVMGCDGNGDNGRMQSTPRFGDCPAPRDAYISNVAGEDGTRIANHDGSLAETFACIAQLGTQGCGFEQTLESMKRALDGTNSQNEGFLRDDALLAVIIVSDEDDCSAENTFVFDPSPGNDALLSPLGPLSSFRCFEHGVVCEPDEPRSPGQQSDCQAREDSEYMAEVRGYADFVKSLKPDPSLTLVAGITGPSTTVQVELNDEGEPTLNNSCENSEPGATPAVRLDSFFSEFPARSAVASICDQSMERPLSTVAHRIAATANQEPCLYGTILDTDETLPGLQMDCVVEAIVGDSKTDVSSCASGAALPCYQLQVDRDTCPATATGLAITVEEGPAPLPGSHLLVRCAR